MDSKHEVTMCDHEFVKVTGKKTKQVTFYCVHCLKESAEYARELKKEIDSKVAFTHIMKCL